jgi:hypothetical protein
LSDAISLTENVIGCEFPVNWIPQKPFILPPTLVVLCPIGSMNTALFTGLMVGAERVADCNTKARAGASKLTALEVSSMPAIGAK